MQKKVGAIDKHSRPISEQWVERRSVDRLSQLNERLNWLNLWCALTVPSLAPTPTLEHDYAVSNFPWKWSNRRKSRRCDYKGDRPNTTPAGRLVNFSLQTANGGFSFLVGADKYYTYVVVFASFVALGILLAHVCSNIFNSLQRMYCNYKSVGSVAFYI